MSKGPGKVERRLADIFRDQPRSVFTTQEFVCPRLRDTEAAEKHRVAVLRALKKLAKRSMPMLWRKDSRYERDDVWYDYRFNRGRAPDRAPAKEEGRPRKL